MDAAGAMAMDAAKAEAIAALQGAATAPNPHVSQIFYCTPESRHWRRLRWICVFAGCRPSITRKSAQNPRQHSVSIRSLRIL